MIQNLVFLLMFLTCIGAQDNEVSTRHVGKYPMPAFSMLLKVRVDEVVGDDDAGIYLDLEIFQETLERVTQLHLTDIFQQVDGPVEFDEEFLRIQLSSKIRQDLLVEQSQTSGTVFVPLHAGFSGVASYSFPKGLQPSEEEMDMIIQERLTTALVADNYMLLFRRYLSSGVLADIEDVTDIRIGTQLLNIEETVAPKDKETGAPGTSSSNYKSSKTKLNSVTIVSIVVFLTMSCLLLIFGATVVLLMKDRAKQEKRYNRQVLSSIGMGADHKKKSASETDEEEDDNKTANTEETILPVWKRAILPILRKAIMVRRYWRKQLRKQRRARKEGKVTPSLGNPNEAAASTGGDNNIMPEEDDDGLKDEDVYYDENLSDEEAANQWLDAWSKSITSIPVRSISSTTGKAPPAGSPSKKHVKKKKASKAQLAPRPAKRQSKKAFLCCITEEDSVVDTNSVMDPADLELSLSSSLSPRSSLVSPRASNTTKICLELERIEELAAVVLEQDFPTISPSNSHPPIAAPGIPSLATSATFPGAYGSSDRRMKQALPGLNEEEERLGRIQDVDLS